MNTSELFYFLIFGISWLVFGIITLRFIGRLVTRELENEKVLKITLSSLILDFLFLCLSVYGFYMRVFKEIISEILVEGNIVTIIVAFIVLCIVYFGVLGSLSFFVPVFEKYFRYSITVLCFYVFITFFLIVLIKSQNRMHDIWQLASQIFSIYSWFLAVLFPFELGNIARKNKRYKNKPITNK